MTHVLCRICDSEITSKRAFIYCGVVCRNRGIAKDRGSFAMEDNPSWKGGTKMCGSNYLLRKHPTSTRKDGYKQEHRIVMEEHIGRLLKSDEDVHHINGDKLDNRIENLEILSRSEHMSLHALNKLNERERDSFGKFK